ncbi:hypothetical protein P9209_18410 [Prescottella defluvii]|nr:hypothetical protein P9209_18410 [Prescottella defluvii]
MASSDTRSSKFSLGNYNLLGALVLLAVSALMLAAALARVPVLASAAAVLAAAAAVSIYVQLGRTDVWLGATATTAAVFVCAAVVAAATQRLLVQSSPQPTWTPLVHPRLRGE